MNKKKILIGKLARLQVRNLCGIVVSGLSSVLHTKNISKVTFYTLRNTAKCHPFLLKEDAIKLFHAFLPGILDYSNDLIPQKHIHLLQLVQNAAVRLLSTCVFS